MIDLLHKYDWSTNAYQRMVGTEDWAEVVDLGEGGYSWAEFKAFYSPSARRYFWHGDRGCSCNGWKDDLSAAQDFEDGDRKALLRAWESFARDNQHTIHTSDYLSGVIEINNFKEPK